MENLTPLQQNRLQTLLDRTAKEWSKIAQEPIKVEVLDDTFAGVCYVLEVI